MNALDQKSTGRRACLRPNLGLKRGLTLAAAFATLCISACADIQRATSLPPVNPESPVAAQVAAAARKDYPRPSLQAVPPTPMNLPTAAILKGQVVDMVRCRRAFDQWAPSHPQLTHEPEAFATSLRRLVDQNPADIPTPQQAAMTQVEADKLRAYAEPPPPMHLGPPPNTSLAMPPAVATAQPAARLPASVVHKPQIARLPVAAASPAVASATPAPTAAVSASGRNPATASMVDSNPPPAFVDPLLAHCS
jgi:hypothetical protein